MRAIIYTRVSTEDQATGYSLSYQEDRLRRYCDERSIEILDHYQDDHSAKTFNRPAFKKLVEYVRRHKNQVNQVQVLVTKWDRFTRAGYEETGRALASLRDCGVEVIAIEQPLDEEVPENLMLKAIYIVQGHIENRRRSLNTKSGMIRAMEQGRYISKPPIGYKYGRDERNRPIIVRSDKAEMIREIFEEFARGNHNAESIRKYARTRYGIYLTRSNSPRLLRNRLYIGEIEITDPKTKITRIVKAVHEPIVDVNTFETVQAMLAGSRQKRKRISYTPMFPLRGILYCPDGHKMTASMSRGKLGIEYGYYHCQSGCRHRFRSNLANSSFSRLLSMLKPRKQVVELFLKILHDVYKQNGAELKREIRSLTSDLNALEKKLLAIDERLVEGAIDADSYVRLKAHYKSDISQKQQLRDMLVRTDENFIDHVREGMNLLANMDIYYDRATPERKARIAGSIFPQGIVFDGESYRTPIVNEVLRVMLSNNINLESGRATELPGISRMVPLTSLISKTFVAHLNLVRAA